MNRENWVTVGDRGAFCYPLDSELESTSKEVLLNQLKLAHEAYTQLQNTIEMQRELIINQDNSIKSDKPSVSDLPVGDLATAPSLAQTTKAFKDLGKANETVRKALGGLY